MPLQHLHKAVRARVFPEPNFSYMRKNGGLIMASWRFCLYLAAPIILPEIGPLTLDTALIWMSLADQGGPLRQPNRDQWIESPALPLQRDPVSGLWALSSVWFPDPGVYSANLGYRTSGNSGFQFESVSVFAAKDDGSGPFRSATYDLSAWYTPRLVFDAEIPEESFDIFLGLLRRLAALGVGRKTAAGYGAIHHIDPPQRLQRSAVWDHGRPRRPIPVTAIRQPLDAPIITYQVKGPRWSGPATPCYVPDPLTWRPIPVL